MSAAIVSLPIAEAAAGMVLAEALRDDGGAVLLPAGATLSDASLRSLRRRGVATLSVIGAAVAGSADAAADAAHGQAERERQCARLARLFRHSAEADGAGAQLLAHLLRYRSTP